jgi:hypothetical protein
MFHCLEPNRSMKLYPGASNPADKASAMINVVVAFLAFFSASVFLAHGIEAYSSSKTHATVVQKGG